MKNLCYIVLSLLLAGSVAAVPNINKGGGVLPVYRQMQQDTLRLVSQPTEEGVAYRLYLDKPGGCELVFSLEGTDESDITPVCCGQDNGTGRFDCFAVYNGSADGNRFLLYDYNRQQAYITSACFADFYPIPASVDLVKQELYLENTPTVSRVNADTLDIGVRNVYVPYARRHRVVKARLVLLEECE